MVNIGNEWDELLKGEFDKEYYLRLRQFLISEYSQYKIYPNMYNIFNALKYTSYSDVKAVILGQDPYHQPGQAHGLCFSVQKGTPQPPSLQNIFKELKSDLGIEPPHHGELISWAQNGVLLMNTVLTVREGQPNSHKGKGWEIFTDRVIQLLNEREKPMGFHTLGRKCTLEKVAHNKSCTPYPRISAPKSAFRLQRIFRQQTFFKDERVPCFKGH